MTGESSNLKYTPLGDLVEAAYAGSLMHLSSAIASGKATYVDGRLVELFGVLRHYTFTEGITVAGKPLDKLSYKQILELFSKLSIYRGPGEDYFRAINLLLNQKNLSKLKY